jgi:transcription initiation factor TFIIB
MTAAIPFPLRVDPHLKDEGKPKQFQPNLNVKLICPDCRIEPPSIVEEFASGDLVCGDCGLVLGDRIIDTRSEWRTFANDEGDVCVVFYIYIKNIVNNICIFKII